MKIVSSICTLSTPEYYILLMEDMKLGISPLRGSMMPILGESQSCLYQVNLCYGIFLLISWYILNIIAVQVWNLATLLPLLVGDLIPEDEPHWECFLLLIEITKNVTARLTSPAVAAYVSALVHQHHSEFKKCYPSVALTPKFHYMVHFPSQMTR